MDFTAQKALALDGIASASTREEAEAASETFTSVLKGSPEIADLTHDELEALRVDVKQVREAMRARTRVLRLEERAGVSRQAVVVNLDIIGTLRAHQVKKMGTSKKGHTCTCGAVVEPAEGVEDIAEARALAFALHQGESI